MAQQVKDPTLPLQRLGPLCGAGSIPGPGTSACCRLGQKKKKKNRNELSPHTQEDDYQGKKKQKRK